MTTVGLIGGVGPESTIEYYRFIIDEYRARKNDDTYPSIIINSIDVNKYVALATANRFDKFADELVVEIDRLARAGADFAALADGHQQRQTDSVARRLRCGPWFRLDEGQRNEQNADIYAFLFGQLR
jgi:aspartate racemase